MEISKKDIKCKEIVERIERITSSVRKFIQLVNQSLPSGKKLNKESFIIQREEYHSFMNDGNTICPGFFYNVYWSYTSKGEVTNENDITQLRQQNAVTFLLECGERCYDHMQNRSYFFSIYCKFNNSEDEAERIDYINDNYEDNSLFQPYEIMQVVWKIRKALDLCISNVPEDPEVFEKFVENFKDVEVKMQDDLIYMQTSKVLPKELIDKLYEFKEKANRFASIVNCYAASYSGNLKLEIFKEFFKCREETDYFLEGKITEPLFSAIKYFLSDRFIGSDTYQFFPKSFLIEKDSHYTLKYNERPLSFHLDDCIKCVLGYSYFNEYISLQGVEKNWYPRLMYFSYYISKDFEKVYYTISLTSCEDFTKKGQIRIIEATTLEELFSPKNAIIIAKWLEEIWSRTELMYYYSSQIKQKEIKNFDPTCEIC